ncbi:MAG: hypothetical protein AB7O66_10425 [Limisphaerales bacterium]
MRFRYATDPLCLAACALYALNRWVVLPRVEGAFLHGQFNDLLLIPAALPWVLWAQRRLGLRRHDAPPTWSETGLHLAVWSLICEIMGPLGWHRGVADPWDVAAYVAGGIVAGVWWNRGTHQPGILASP